MVIYLGIKAKKTNTEKIKNSIDKCIKNIKEKTTYGFSISKVGIYSHSKTLNEIALSFYPPLFCCGLNESWDKQQERKDKAYNEMKGVFMNFKDNLNKEILSINSKIEIRDY